MSEFNPIETLEDLSFQDEDEMVSGYIAGLGNASEPGSDKSRSFWHGWRNGMMDRGARPHDSSARILAEAVVRKQRAH